MKRRSWLIFAPGVTLALFLLPIGAGLLGTWLPSFGYLPVLGSEAFSLEPWRALFARPGLVESLRLTLISGLGGTLLAFALTIGFVAACHDTRFFAAARRLLAPLLALPHVAVAIGLAFLIAPSGWLLRLVSPWATGLELPPDVATLQDPNGLALALGLAVKETPFLLLMTLGALGQVRQGERLATARGLGYGPVAAWLKTVLPAVYPLIRLPIYAVLAFSLSVVDMAIVLAPATPPPLAVQVFNWFYDPDLALRTVASAGATLQLGLVIAGIALWRGGEILLRRLSRGWLTGGWRGWGGGLSRRFAAAALSLALALGYGGILALTLWSFAFRWRYPDALPASWTLDTWARQGDALWRISLTTLAIGLAAALIALALTLACLENEKRHGKAPGSRALWLLYLPLLVPQIGFLFGVQTLGAWSGLDGTWLAVIWSHLLFVLPYAFLALADPYRALDERYNRAALCLGASPGRVFWRIKLPLLLRPVLFAGAVAFAVSVAQFLPTVFAGAGRFTTLTTEAVSLAGGGDRRVIGVYAFLQAALPLAFFALAIALPAWRARRLPRAGR
ncbi:MAG: ABC transporter permease subunit [Rhodovibrionaceae bacterium]